MSNIIELNQSNKPQQPAGPTDPKGPEGPAGSFPPLNAQAVTAIRMKALALQEMLSHKIEVPGREQQIRALIQEIGNFFCVPENALEFIGAWYAVKFEYAPLLHVLGPVLARSQSQFAQEQMARAAARKQEATNGGTEPAKN